MSFSFQSMDLSEIKDDTQKRVKVEAGVHNSKITNAEIRDDSRGCKRLYLEWTVMDTGGKSRENIVLWRPQGLPDYFDDYVSQGQRKLKSILTHGGADDPNRPGSLDVLKGMQMAVTYAVPEKNCEKRNKKCKTWLNENGEEVPNACEPITWGAYGPLQNGAAGNPAVVIEEKYMDNGSGAPLPSSYDDSLDGLTPDEPPPF